MIKMYNYDIEKGHQIRIDLSWHGMHNIPFMLHLQQLHPLRESISNKKSRNARYCKKLLETLKKEDAKKC